MAPHALADVAAAFAAFGLGFKRLGGPIEPRIPYVFQFDIRRSDTWGEYFRLWPGAPGTEICVLAGDARLAQLVLSVKEGRHPFLQRMERSLSPREIADVAARLGGRLVSDLGTHYLVELWTSHEERRYLCGRDDVNLFIAPLREGTTVAEAQASLRPRSVDAAERARPGTTRRQGEWFFLSLDHAERATLEEELASGRARLVRTAPVGPGRRPHIAAEVAIAERHHQGRRRSFIRRTIYARGAVLHVDHRPLPLDGWMRVVRNRELDASSRDLLRLRWRD